MLEFENVSKKYGKKEILKNINLKFEAKTYVISGYNGAGKTTLVNLLTKIDQQYTGEIIIDNVNYKKINKEIFLTNYVSYSIQKNEFIDNYTPNQLIDLLVGKCDEQNKTNIVSKLSLTKVMNKKYKKLSGGEKQKIKLVIAFLKESKILILDEPFNNLDNKSIDLVMEIINIQKNKLVLVIDHNLDEYDFAHSKIEIDEGKINLITQEIKKDINIQSNEEVNNLKTQNLNSTNIGYDQKKNKKFKLNFKQIMLLNFKNFKSGIFLLIFTILFFGIFSLFISGMSQQIDRLNEYSGIEKGNMILSIDPNSNCDNVCQSNNKISFSKEDITKLEETAGVNAVKDLYFSFSASPNSPIIPQENLMLDKSIKKEEVIKYVNESNPSNGKKLEENLQRAKSMQISAETMMLSKEMASKFPIGVTVSGGKEILFGTYPSDKENNEVMISQMMAKYIVDKNNLSSIEDVVDKSIELPVQEVEIIDGQVTGEIIKETIKKVKVVGIYSTTHYANQSVIFGYDEDSYMYKHNLPSNQEKSAEQLEDSFDSYNSTREDFGQQTISYEEYEKLQGEGIESIYINYDPSLEKEMYDKVQELYPNNIVFSHYGTTFGIVGEKLKNSIKIYVLQILVTIFGLIILLLIFSQQYYQMKLKQNKLFKLFGMSNNYYNRINLIEQAIYVIISILFGTILVNNLVYEIPMNIIYVSALLFIVIEVVVFIINMLISKIIYNKFLEKRGVR